MFNLLKKKEKNISATTEKDEDIEVIEHINITAQEAKQKIQKKLSNPTYEEIKKDILKAINIGKLDVTYEKAYIDSDLKERLEKEGFLVVTGTILFSGHPYFSVYWR